jgi:regulator of protease activity HflC (stomatin/prohibitin superfamily)
MALLDKSAVAGAFQQTVQGGRKGALWALLGVVLIGAIFIGSGGLIETKKADEILAIQSIGTGDITWYTSTESWVWQGWGNATTYKKRAIFEFDHSTGKESKDCDNGIDVRFNDGGHAVMCGSIQYDMPTDAKSLTEIHTKYGSQDAVQRQLVEKITGTAVYLSGPLMSSRESFSEKRNDLVRYIEDQIQNGIYRTQQREVRVKDSITNSEKTQTVVEIVLGKNGLPERQEAPVLARFGIKPFGFTIKRMPYDAQVEKQIQQQQQITMDVQTAIADSKKAEQRTLTVTEQGKANAAEAKWKQEQVKATAVVTAEQEKAVAILDAEKERDTAKLKNEAANFYKQEQIARGEGDAAYRRLVMQANGALELKLATYERVMTKFAEEFGKQKWVPEVQMGGGGSSSASGAQAMMDALSVKAMRDLAIDVRAGGSAAQDNPGKARK